MGTIKLITREDRGYDMVEPSEDAKLLCARLVHAVNTVYCVALNEPTFDFATVRDSVLAGIEALVDDPDLTPEQSHEKWMEYKVADGWRLGPTKSLEKKEHPYLMPYTMLGPNQRFKDVLFTTIVREFFGIVPRQIAETPKSDDPRQPAEEPTEEALEAERCAASEQRLAEITGKMFDTVKKGPPSATTSEGVPYVTYAFAARDDGTRNWRPTLETEMIKVLGALALASARVIIMRTGFEYERVDGYLGLRVRLAALKSDGTPVSVERGRKAEGTMPHLVNPEVSA